MSGGDRSELHTTASRGPDVRLVAIMAVVAGVVVLARAMIAGSARSQRLGQPWVCTESPIIGAFGLMIASQVHSRRDSAVDAPKP